MNSYISLNKPVFDKESDRALIDLICGEYESNPEEIVIDREKLLSMKNYIGKLLSGLESEVLTSYLKGKSYQEIAQEMGRHVKSIDNALQRIKAKLDKFLASG